MHKKQLKTVGEWGTLHQLLYHAQVIQQTGMQTSYIAMQWGSFLRYNWGGLFVCLDLLSLLFIRTVCCCQIYGGNFSISKAGNVSSVEGHCTGFHARQELHCRFRPTGGFHMHMRVVPWWWYWYFVPEKKMHCGYQYWYPLMSRGTSEVSDGELLINKLVRR